MEYIQPVKDETAKLLLDYIRRAAPKSILEIGTGKGHSGMLMLSAAPSARLVTVEKNAQAIVQARENFDKAGLSCRVEIIHGDAAEVLPELCGQFDFIFLDGAKGQYIKYLPRLTELLSTGGILAADNVLFRGMVEGGAQPPHEYRSMVNNLRRFLTAIKTDSRFKTEVFNVGDGLSVSLKEEI